MNNPETIFECLCIHPKKYRVIFDGGQTGQYSVEMCENCFEKDDKKYSISIEKLEET